MWFYDDILIKAISHGVGTVIKNIPTHRGFITALLQQMEDAQTEDKRMMNVGTDLNVLHCSGGLNSWRKTERRCPVHVHVLSSDYIYYKCRYLKGAI